MVSTSHNNKNSLSEATYIKKISERRPNEKKRSKKVQRIVSSLVVLFCIAFLVVGGMDLVSATSSAYVLTVDDQEVATMVSEKEAQEALGLCLEQQAEEYLSEYNTTGISYTNNVEIEEVSSIGVIYSSVNEAAGMLVDHLDLVANAVQLLVDGETVFYVASEMDAIQAVNLAKSHFGSTQEDGVLNVYTTEQISMKNGTIACEEIFSLEDAVHMLIYGQLTETDTPEPLITVNVEREEKAVAPLPYETVRVDNPDMTRGTEEVVTAGEDGTQELTMKITEVNGVEVSSEQVGAEVVTAAVDEVIEVGTLLIISSRGTNGSGEFGWPLASGTGTVTSRFGWRSRGWHSGVDIANPVGTTIYASESGTVVTVEYQSGYGNLVIIDHGNGVQTYYAHCDVFYVSVGDFVERGTAIADIGMTGTTTGPHVHFEIRIDGTAVDPLPYIE